MPDPEQWPNAVDEILRLESPVQLTARICRRDTQLVGQPIRAGQPVTTILAAANRDPAVFAEPQAFDVTRKNAGRHLSFSSGRHYCVGAALARAEGEIGLRRLFARFPALTSAGIPTRRPTRVLRGWVAMPVRLLPRYRPIRPYPDSSRQPCQRHPSRDDHGEIVAGWQ